MTPDPDPSTLPLAPVPPLDPRRVEAIRAHAHRVAAQGVAPVVRLEAATSAVFAVWMIVWAVSAVIVPATT